VDPEGEGMTATTTAQPIVQGKDLNKSFGRVVGLADCNFELYPGEVCAVVGDNGAGKSTLIKCLSGALSPDSGEMFVSGNRVAFKSTNDARAHGVEWIETYTHHHQSNHACMHIVES
jgi:fructose transport system ATP-binding protein